MKKSFSFIAHHIDESKFKSIVNDGLSYNEETFKAIRKVLPKHMKIEGFTSILKVPFNSYGKLTKPILVHGCYSNNVTVKLLLKGWFLKHENLRTIVQEKLVMSGYNIIDHKFINNSFELNPLKKEDIFTSTDERNYFRPQGNSIEGFDEIETTLMAALLGWMALSEEGMNKVTKVIENFETISGNNEDRNEPDQDDKNVENEKLSNIDNITDDVIIEDVTVMNQWLIENSQAEIAFESKIDPLLDELKSIFQLESEFFLKLSDDLKKGTLPVIDEVNSRIKNLTDKFYKVKNAINESVVLKTNSLQDLIEIYLDAQLKESTSFKNKTLVNDILTKIIRISVKKGEVPVCIHTIIMIAKNFISKLESPENQDAEWFIKILAHQHFFNYIIQAVELVNKVDCEFDELDEILEKIKLEFENNQLTFYDLVAAQINRSNLKFSDALPPGFPTGETDSESITKSGPDVTLINKSETEVTKSNLAIIPELEVIENQHHESKFQEIKDIQESVSEVEIEIGNPILQVESVINETPVGTAFQLQPEEKNKEVKLSDLDPAAVSTIGKPSSEDELGEEDSNILSLLMREEPELAYHLAKCYENEKKELVLPSYLLQNLFLSVHIRTATGPVAQIMETNFLKYKFISDKTDKGHFINQMVFASILRPCFFAYDSSGAGILLHDIYSGKNAEFSEIKKLVNEFMAQNSGVLSYERINQINGQVHLKENREKYLSRIEEWLQQAKIDRFRKQPKHYHTLAYNSWVRKGGWIDSLLSRFLQDKDGSVLRKILVEDLEDSAWEKKFQKDLKGIASNQKQALSNTEAFRWFSNNIDSLKTLLEEGLSYFEDASIGSTPHDDDLTSNFIKKILDEFARIEQILDPLKTDSIFNHISFKYIKYALNNVTNLLKGSGSEKAQLPVFKIVNSPLLKLPYYDSDFNWKPKEYNTTLAGLIVEYSSKPARELSLIAGEHIISGNIEALNRITSLGIINEDNLIDSDNLNEFSGRLNAELNNSRTEIERGCAFGYILNGHREYLISAIKTIEEDNNLAQDGINYPLRKSQVDNVLNGIHRDKQLAVDRQRLLLNGEIKSEYQDFLKDLLEKGNLLVFNETLERIKENQFVIAEEKSGLFRDFYQGFLKHENTGDLSLFLKAIRDRVTFKSLDYGKIAEFQAKEAEEIITRWQTVKRSELKHDLDSFLKVKPFLEVIGFVSSVFESADRFKKVVYFDFTCTPIKGRSRTPLPQYGSVAQGKYRLITILDRITEEDQVETIKELIPITNRPVLVFSFFWMNQKNRLSVAKLSKKGRITFLQLDESMLVYLFSLKESILPAFIKLTAPFTFAEPYQTASSNLPEEMFYGRKPQIQKIKNIIGDFSCLIYGGRQLGKTVLQREVERIFNQPEKGYYAIYIDLRDSGIGMWKPIEEITQVLIENLSIIPGLIPEKYNPLAGLSFLLNRIKEWIDKNKDARIILFLDESDKFLEKDSLKEWPHVLPLKGLMEKTDKRFKVVLAGLHDVRRTMKIPNNPLAHFGSPICVGPMLEKEEAIEAQLLIKLPFETLGAEFESEDLVFMILSHCNWYPSLIQIFCSKLLDVLYEKRQLIDLPVIINAADITSAYERSRDKIKEKFNLTLILDERYDLLANIIASETIENPLIHTHGISVEDISQMATLYWPEGFDSTNPKVEIKNLLEEMVDLGILRIESSGRAALRTPNLLGLIGNEKQIKENLLLKERVLPSEFKREISRILYTKDLREVRSPFPAFYFDKLIDPDSKVVLFRGSIMGGIEYVSEFLKSRKKEINLIIPEYSGLIPEDHEELWKPIEKKRVTGKHNLILFDETKKHTYESIHSILELVESKTAFTAVFLIDSENLWNILSKNDKSFERLENLKVQIFNIPQWRQDVASDWFRETGCITADVSEVFHGIANWHKLLDEYHSAIFNTPESWQEKLTAYSSELKLKGPDILPDFGLLNKDLIESIRELIEWDGSITRNEFIHENSNSKTSQEKEVILDYFLFLNLIDNKLIVNDFIKKILSNE